MIGFFSYSFFRSMRRGRKRRGALRRTPSLLQHQVALDGLDSVLGGDKLGLQLQSRFVPHQGLFELFLRGQRDKCEGFCRQTEYTRLPHKHLCTGDNLQCFLNGSKLLRKTQAREETSSIQRQHHRGKPGRAQEPRQPGAHFPKV